MGVIDVKHGFRRFESNFGVLSLSETSWKGVKAEGLDSDGRRRVKGHEHPSTKTYFRFTIKTDFHRLGIYE